MEFWNNASTGMKILIVVVLALAVLALIFILSNAFGSSPQEPTAPAATQTPVPTPKPSEPPVAVISGPTQTQVGQPVMLSAADSRAAEGSQLVSYQWDMGDGVQSTNIEVTHIYAKAGRYDVKLTVTDNKGLDSSSTIKMEVAEAPETPTLEDQDWSKMSVLQGTEITATFKNGKVSGTSGCNDYSGSYKMDGNLLSVANLAGGRKACDQLIMDQETTYLAALEAATAYQVSGESLTINSTLGPIQYLAAGN